MVAAQRAVAYAASATGTLPTVQAGDLLLAFALRDGATGIPAEPSGWTTPLNGTGSGGATSGRVAYRFWQSGDAAPVFTNASAVVIASISGVGPAPIGAVAQSNMASGSDTVTIPALSLTRPDGTALVASAYLHRMSSSLTTPDQMTEYVDSLEGTLGRVGYSLTTARPTAFAARTVTATAQAGWRSIAVEIVANPSSMLAYL